MSLCEQLTVLFAVLFSLVTSDIYKSVMWTTNNPLFLNSTGLSPCHGEDLEMRVHLTSSLPVVCPFDFIIMQTLQNKPATSVLYENFWIVYDEESFKNCDINMTYRGPNKEENQKLLNCDAPETLTSFSYTIEFKIKSPVNTKITFDGGKYYYFLATSDGTQGSLTSTKGGHCNGPNIRMKFKVYVCKDNKDEKCQNVPIGEFLCPNEIPATTISPSATTEVYSKSDTEVYSKSGTEVYSKSSTESPSTTADTTSNQTNETNDPSKAQLHSNELHDELSTWRTVAILFICLAAMVLVIGTFCYFAKRHKDKPDCFNDMNRVTPPQEPPASKNTNSSYNNLTFCEDYEDGKNTHHHSKYEPQIEKLPTAPALEVINNCNV